MKPAADTVMFPIVGVGASAGGLDAFRRLLRQLPSDSGLAFVLIQHLDPNHESMMADLLQRYTSMPVVQVEDSTPIKRNHVYMIPPNKYLKLRGSTLLLDEPVKTRGMRMPIDYFFRSLAETRRETGIAIILSGTGTDGMLGLKDVKAAGGMVMVQTPESAEYDGMPRSAISTGLVDFTSKIEKMPETLVRFVRHPYLENGTGESLLEGTEPDVLNSILAVLRTHTDYDFRCYKKGTLGRRIHRRMGLKHVDSIHDYLRALRRDPEEVQLLFKDLLISVTRFFREPEAWSALETDVISSLVARKKFDDPLRVWVPGCATGEEAYGLGMLIYEQLEIQRKNLDVQIFATDLDAQAIEFARAGAYPASVAADISSSRLKKFMVEDGDVYRVNKKLRESTVFAVQNLIADPPFSKLDFVSCRNLLIYLEGEVQRRLIEMFHFALAPDSYLFLGTSETIGKHTNLFRPVSKTWRIYQRIGSTRRTAGSFPVVPSADRAEALPQTTVGAKTTGSSATAEAARRTLLDRFAPAAVLVNWNNEVQYFHGQLGNYLEFPAGEPTRDLPSLAVPGLNNKLRALIHRAAEDGKPVTVAVPRIRRGEEEFVVRLTAETISDGASEEALTLVTFEDERQIAPTATRPNVDTDAAEMLAVQQLEYELQATREDLQSTIEELETSNEELKASNEEVMSMNEELQSTNEELETSREELQSLNEELATVNNQLEEKVIELETTNDDLRNLLTSTEIATIFLDTDLRIRRFTPATAELLSVISTDVGRPISDLSPRVNDPDLLEDAHKVLKKLTFIEKEVKVTNGGDRAFLRRIRPYRSADDRIEGVVITFTDISRLVQAVERAKKRESQQAAIAQLGRKALAGADLDELLSEASEVMCKTLKGDSCKVLELNGARDRLSMRAGWGWKDGSVGKATVDVGDASHAGYTLQSRAPVVVEDFESESRFAQSPLSKDHKLVSGISVTIGPVHNPWGVLGAHTKKKTAFTQDDINFVQSMAFVLSEAISGSKASAALQRSEEHLRLAQEAAELGSWDWDIAQDEVRVSGSFQDLYAWDPELPFSFDAWLERLHPEDRAAVRKAVSDTLERGSRYETEFRVQHSNDGETRWLRSRGEVTERGPDGKARRMTGVSFDVTERRNDEEELRHQQEELEERVAERTKELTEANVSLRESRAELSALTSRLITVQEDSFRRLARDLHDGFSQDLAGLAITIGELAQMVDNPPKGFDSQVKKARESIEYLSSDIHRLARQLHPAMLVELGLCAAIEDLCESLRNQHGIEIDCDLEISEERLGEELKLCLYRVAQETLSNIQKHSRAVQAKLDIALDECEVSLKVSDQGEGFEMHPGKPRGLGLVSIEERVRLLGGALQVVSSPKKGTKVSASIPLAD